MGLLLPRIRDSHRLKYQRLNLACMTYILLWCLVPTFSLYTSQGAFRVVFGVATVSWLFTALLSYNIAKIIKPLAAIILFFTIILCYYIIGYGDMRWYEIVKYLLLVAFAFNGIAYNELRNNKLNRYIVRLTIILLTITCMTTVYGLIETPYASRLLTSSSTNESVGDSLQAKNIGSYDFIYGLVLLLPCVIFHFPSEKKRILKIIELVLIPLSVAAIVLSNFTTAQVLLFADVAIIFSFSKKRRPDKLLLLGAILILLLPTALRVYLTLLADNSTTILSYSKLTGILNVMSGSSSMNNLTSRYGLLWKSINAFFSHPFFGVGAYYSVETQMIGYHSTIPDEFARFGIIGGGAIIGFAFWALSKVAVDYENHEKYYYRFIPIIILYFILGFLNPIFNYAILASIYIIAPSLIRTAAARGLYENSLHSRLFIISRGSI